jgi:hypothetical protein
LAFLAFLPGFGSREKEKKGGRGLEPKPEEHTKQRITLYPRGRVSMVTFTINIPPRSAYIPYMDPMGIDLSTSL